MGGSGLQLSGTFLIDDRAWCRHIIELKRLSRQYRLALAEGRSGTETRKRVFPEEVAWPPFYRRDDVSE